MNKKLLEELNSETMIIESWIAQLRENNLTTFESMKEYLNSAICVCEATRRSVTIAHSIRNYSIINLRGYGITFKELSKITGMSRQRLSRIISKGE